MEQAHPSGGDDRGSALQEETITWLEMHSPEELRASGTDRDALDVRRIADTDILLGKAMYQAVGHDWLWIDRLVWSDEQWREYYARPGISLWIGYAGSDAAGYFELAADDKGNTELAYFGLVRGFIGNGLGGLLLTVAIEKAWQGGTRRVWVHTSNRDHAGALANYEARGMRIYHRETKMAPTSPTLAG